MDTAYFAYFMVGCFGGALIGTFIVCVCVAGARDDRARSRIEDHRDATR
jgi:hypothetical protein